MLSVLSKLGSWLLRKLGGGVLVVLLGLASYGVWLFLRDNYDFVTRKEELTQLFSGQRARLLSARGEVERQLADARTESMRQQQRAQQAERVIAAVRSESGWWQRFFGDRAQWQANAERLAHLEKLRNEARSSLARARKDIETATWTKEGLDIALGKLERQLETLKRNEPRVVRYLRSAWEDACWYVVGTLVAFLVGPSLWKLAMFYGFAPMIVRGRSVRFAETMTALPAVDEGGVSIDVALWPGELLRIKEKFLQASDEGFAKKTRFLLDWHIPFTSVACGLIELVEMRHPHAGGDLRVTLSSSDDPHTELASVAVPEGASLVLRPSFLAGVIVRRDAPLVIRRRWALWRWQSWVTGQFRYFEFLGPCRLIVSGTRGVRVESLAARGEQPGPARRANREATIGFTPTLDYRPVRAETFWGYYRGMNPLFDDLFAGDGLFLCQGSARGSEPQVSKRFWAAVWNGVLKMFGL